MGTMMKGTAMKPYVDWIRGEVGEHGWDRILERLDADDVSALSTLAGGAAVPSALLGRLLQAFDAERGGMDHARADDAFRRMGRSIADEHLSGVYSIFARFASPQQAFSKVPSLLSNMYMGIEASAEPAADGRGGVLTIRGLGDVPYSGPRLAGWGERALERFGAKGVHVNERNWDAGRSAADELVLDVCWS